MKHGKIGLLSLFTIASLSSAKAAPVTYSLIGMTLQDGGTVTGTLTYDVVTQQLGDFSVVVTDANMPMPQFTLSSTGIMTGGADGTLTPLGSNQILNGATVIRYGLGNYLPGQNGFSYVDLWVDENWADPNVRAGTLYLPTNPPYGISTARQDHLQPDDYTTTITAGSLIAVPEPAAMGVVLLGSTVVLSRRVRGRKPLAV